MEMVEYGLFTITEDEYHKERFCNGKPGNPSIFHYWEDIGDICWERCTKCGRARFIVKRIPNYDTLR